MMRLIFLLVLLAAAPVFAAPTITLPDNGIYYYWFSTSGGAVDHGVTQTKGSNGIDLAKQTAVGPITLYILDPHTAGIAVLPVSSAAKEITVTVGEFKVPASDSITQTSAPNTPPPANTPASAGAEPDQGILSKIVTAIIGIAVIGGVVWFFRSLYLTKGQPLIDIARKVGVDVPNPDDIPKTEIEHDGKYEPPPIVRVQPIPEAATRPVKQPAIAGYLTADSGASYGIGSKTLSIGRVEENDIVLNDTSVSRRHARIEPQGNSAELFDENSANGVFVNGQRITRQILSPGDSVHIGRVSLRYEK